MLYTLMSSVFSVIVVLSSLISAKMIAVPYFQDFSIPAGLITYPVTFLLSDLVTELFGAKKAKWMVYIAFAMSLLSYGMIQIALILPAQDVEFQRVFCSAFGLNGLIVAASLTAYVVAQIVDIQLYALIKKWTGSRFLWLRNNGSVCISQLIDTLIVTTIHLYWGLGMPMSQVVPIMLFSYTYKAVFSVANTPLFYLCVSRLRKADERLIA